MCCYICRGRKRACVTYCITYILICITKHSPEYKVLIIGRYVGGIVTSLLFSAFESWLVAEHFKVMNIHLTQTIGVVCASLHQIHAAMLKPGTFKMIFSGMQLLSPTHMSLELTFNLKTTCTFCKKNFKKKLQGLCYDIIGAQGFLFLAEGF